METQDRTIKVHDDAIEESGCSSLEMNDGMVELEHMTASLELQSDREELSVDPYSCAACRSKLLQKGLRLTLDDGSFRLFHHECMKCYACGEMFTSINPLGVAPDMKIYCQKDYTRLFQNDQEGSHQLSDKSVVRLLKKHGRWGAPKSHKVVINGSRGLLDYSGRTLHLSNLQRILRGKKTKAFMRSSAKDIPAAHCISLQFRDGRIVNFECASKEQREEVLRLVRDATLAHLERVGKKAFFQKSTARPKSRENSRLSRSDRHSVSSTVRND